MKYKKRSYRYVYNLITKAVLLTTLVTKCQDRASIDFLREGLWRHVYRFEGF